MTAKKLANEATDRLLDRVSEIAETAHLEQARQRAIGLIGLVEALPCHERVRHEQDIVLLLAAGTIDELHERAAAMLRFERWVNELHSAVGEPEDGVYLDPFDDAEIAAALEGVESARAEYHDLASRLAENEEADDDAGDPAVDADAELTELGIEQHRLTDAVEEADSLLCDAYKMVDCFRAARIHRGAVEQIRRARSTQAAHEIACDAFRREQDRVEVPESWERFDWLASRRWAEQLLAEWEAERALPADVAKALNRLAAVSYSSRIPAGRA